MQASICFFPDSLASTRCCLTSPSPPSSSKYLAKVQALTYAAYTYILLFFWSVKKDCLHPTILPSCATALAIWCHGFLCALLVFGLVGLGSPHSLAEPFFVSSMQMAIHHLQGFELHFWSSLEQMEQREPVGMQLRQSASRFSCLPYEAELGRATMSAHLITMGNNAQHCPQIRAADCTVADPRGPWYRERNGHSGLVTPL